MVAMTANSSAALRSAPAETTNKKKHFDKHFLKLPVI
jgi:hypothetical protein